MARDQSTEAEIRQTRRLLAAVLGLGLIAIFLVWRIDSPRVERLRMAVIDRIVPDMGWALVPVARIGAMVADFTSYARVYEQNRELRRELHVYVVRSLDRAEPDRGQFGFGVRHVAHGRLLHARRLVG